MIGLLILGLAGIGLTISNSVNALPKVNPQDSGYEYDMNKRINSCTNWLRDTLWLIVHAIESDISYSVTNKKMKIIGERVVTVNLNFTKDDGPPSEFIKIYPVEGIQKKKRISPSVFPLIEEVLSDRNVTCELFYEKSEDFTPTVRITFTSRIPERLDTHRTKANNDNGSTSSKKNQQTEQEKFARSILIPVEIMDDYGEPGTYGTYVSGLDGFPPALGLDAGCPTGLDYNLP